LNATVLPIGSPQTYGWFEWGNTPDFGNMTTRRFIGAGSPILFSEIISGLAPGTTYFFKPVAENQNGRFEGVLFSFHTTGTASNPPSVSFVSNQTASAVQPVLAKNESKPKVVDLIKDKKTTKETINVEVIPSTNVAAPKDRVSETIQFENTTSATLKEAVVRVILPCDAEYVSAGGDTKNGGWLKTGKMLTYKIGDIKPKEKVKFSFWTEIGAEASDKTKMETIAVVNWEDKTSSGYTQVVGQSVVVVDKNKPAKENTDVLGVATTPQQGYSSFFPTNLKDWGAVIGLLFVFFAGYMIFLITHRKNEEEDEEEVSQIGSFNEPQLNQVLTENNNDPFITNKNTSNSAATIPLVSVKKNATEKGAPPENLPI
jgi:hypothetical protein